MTEPAITPELVAKHNLTTDEYAKIKEILGREPSYTELGIFSVMWSEHCSYKNTRPLLKTFPTKSPKILVGAGEENAGIIDIGDGLAIAFKIESHNHPSAVWVRHQARHIKAFIGNARDVEQGTVGIGCFCQFPFGITILPENLPVALEPAQSCLVGKIATFAVCNGNPQQLDGRNLVGERRV